MNFSPENFILDKDGFINYLWFEIDQKLYLLPQVDIHPLFF